MKEIIFITTLGAEPQVVTLALDALLARSFHINRVVVVHTDPAHEPVGSSLRRLKDEFITDRYYRVDLLYSPHLLAGDSGPLTDIVTSEEIETAFQSFYTLLRQHKQAGRSIHLSIAGGRKTMALFAMAAAQILFTAGDHLWHIVSSKALAVSKSLHAEQPDDVSLVEIPVAYWGHLLPAEPSQTAAFLTQVLTPAEREVAELLVREGLSNSALATRLGKSPKTVANQLTSIYQKLQGYLALDVLPDRNMLFILLGRSS